MPVGGTVAGKVFTPVQNNWHALVAVIGGKIAPEFWGCNRSVMRPPQPELPVPEGIPVPITLEAKVNYRKFDRKFMDYIFGPAKGPELPETTSISPFVVFRARASSR